VHRDVTDAFHQSSTFDAAHLYLVEAKKEQAVGLPETHPRDAVRSRDGRELCIA
jgi:hypothetical protein